MPKSEDGRQKGEEEPEESAPGCAEPAREFNPSVSPEDAEHEEQSDRPKSAPAPGTPVSEDEYQRLKEEARRRRTQPDVPAQEDRPRKND